MTYSEFQTTDEDVARLTRPQREQRVLRLIERSHHIYDVAIRRHGGGRAVIATALLYSGGNDSSTVAHLFRAKATHVVMANTGIGIEQTRQFVRDTAADWNLPLVEKHPPISYADLVRAQGFPGPGHHYKMYQRLKERCFDAARYDLGIAKRRTVCGIYIAGRRRSESERRSMPGQVPLFERDGSVIWVSPLAEWTKLDLNTYRLMKGDVPRNEVSDLIHMSGECLCGAFAAKGEREEIAQWFPLPIAAIRALEVELAERTDIPDERKTWGWGAYRDALRRKAKHGRLCGSCQTRAAA